MIKGKNASSAKCLIASNWLSSTIFREKTWIATPANSLTPSWTFTVISQFYFVISDKAFIKSHIQCLRYLWRSEIIKGHDIGFAFHAIQYKYMSVGHDTICTNLKERTLEKLFHRLSSKACLTWHFSWIVWRWRIDELSNYYSVVEFKLKNCKTFHGLLSLCFDLPSAWQLAMHCYQPEGDG